MDTETTLIKPNVIAMCIYICYVIVAMSPGWISSSPPSSNELCVMTVVDECSRIPEIQKSLRVQDNFTWEITVNDHILKLYFQAFSNQLAKVVFFVTQRSKSESSHC